MLVEIGPWQNLTTVLLHFLRREKTSNGSSPSRPPVQKLGYSNKQEMANINKSKSRLLRETGVGSIREMHVVLKFFLLDGLGGSVKATVNISGSCLSQLPSAIASSSRTIQNNYSSSIIVKFSGKDLF